MLQNDMVWYDTLGYCMIEYVAIECIVIRHGTIQ